VTLKRKQDNWHDALHGDADSSVQVKVSELEGTLVAIPLLQAVLASAVPLSLDPQLHKETNEK
jgi:hypothetical protein